ncbi:hypothetical protein E2C01_024348 [Portunus trituberculatus]|uniref:Uncharacterized protein n=1 Tax=Portunus trituberculatus TaxID=210409 RepID=A0A5B7EA41_PORTR|nr:hypothetical protein [Portunus trituberculatus]
MQGIFRQVSRAMLEKIFFRPPPPPYIAFFGSPHPKTPDFPQAPKLVGAGGRGLGKGRGVFLCIFTLYNTDQEQLNFADVPPGFDCSRHYNVQEMTNQVVVGTWRSRFRGSEAGKR